MALINPFDEFLKCQHNGMSLLFAEDWPELPNRDALTISRARL